LNIAIASGKGGTGKTTVATNLAFFLAGRGRKVIYADGDVEEPNGHLFLKPKWDKTVNVPVKIPLIDESLCDHCGLCSDVCRYNALAVLPDKVMVFESLCHSCGGCYHICPRKAITEIDRTIGIMKSGTGYGVITYEGRLNIGEAISPPVIKFLKSSLESADFTIIDSPPGTSCPVIEAVRDADFVILVTEPTPFGLHDLKLAVEMIRKLGLAFGVVVNRYGVGDERVHDYCRDEGINILLEIPNDRKIAEACSAGNLIVETLPQYAIHFENLLQNILLAHRTTGVRV
jgi:MinD superfamily P-loop ATPase